MSYELFPAVDEDYQFPPEVLVGLSRSFVTKFTPEQFGAVGDSDGTAGSGADDSDALQACYTAAYNATGLVIQAEVVHTQNYRVTKNLYGGGDTNFVGSGCLVLDSDLSASDGAKYWINLGVQSKGVDGDLWRGYWSVNLKTTTNVHPELIAPSPPGVGMRLINAHRADNVLFEKFTIDIRDTGPCKVSGIGCYSDTAWAPTPDKTNIHVSRVNVLALQTGGSTGYGGEGVGGNNIDGFYIKDSYIHGVGDDMIGVHICTNYEVSGNRMYSPDGRLYTSTSTDGKIHDNHVERIQNPDLSWVSGGALAFAEIENVNGPAPSDTMWYNNTFVHGAGIISATYGLRLRGVRRYDVLFNHFIDTSGFGYAVTWEGDTDSAIWTDPEGLDGALQVIKFTGSPSGGTFTPAYAGDPTTAIPLGSSAATLLAALEALPSIAPGDVTVTGTGPYYVSFGGAIPTPVKMTVTHALTGGTAPNAVVVIAPRIRELRVIGNRATGGGDSRIGPLGTAATFVSYEVWGNNPGAGGTTLPGTSVGISAKFPTGLDVLQTTYIARAASTMPINTVFLDAADGKWKYKDADSNTPRILLDRSDTKLSATTVSNALSGTLWTSSTLSVSVPRVGMCLRFGLPLKFSCIASTGGTFKLEHYVNGVLVATSNLINIAQTNAIANYALEPTVTIWVEAIGAGGVVSASVVGKTRSNIGGTIVDENVQTLATSVDLSTGLIYSVLAKMTVADVGNSITLQRAYRTVVA